MHKRYRKTGISFASYSANDEDEDDEDGTTDTTVNPSESLLIASPVWVEMKANTAKQFEDLTKRLTALEQGVGAPSPSGTGSSVSSADLDSAFVSGFASGGSGQKMDTWAMLVVLVHVVMLAVTVCVLVVDGFSVNTWMVCFLFFLVVTLAKLLTTFNQHKAASQGKYKKATIEVAAGDVA